MPKVRFEPGLVLRIPLDDGMHTYARMLARDPFIAYHDLRSADARADLTDVVRSPVLFVLGTTFDLAVESGRWEKVGVVPLSEVDNPIPLRFMQRVGHPEQLSVIDDRGRTRPATFEECVGLERAAVWNDRHIEKRLNDHYAGRPNAQAARLKPIDPRRAGVDPRAWHPSRST